MSQVRAQGGTRVSGVRVKGRAVTDQLTVLARAVDLVNVRHQLLRQKGVDCLRRPVARPPQGGLGTVALVA